MFQAALFETTNTHCAVPNGGIDFHGSATPIPRRPAAGITLEPLGTAYLRNTDGRLQEILSKLRVIGPPQSQPAFEVGHEPPTGLMARVGRQPQQPVNLAKRNFLGQAVVPQNLEIVGDKPDHIFGRGPHLAFGSHIGMWPCPFDRIELAP
jgi:hypothetical protein